MHLFLLIYISIISLISYSFAAPAPLPVDIEIHWQAKLSSTKGPQMDQDHAKLERLRIECIHALVDGTIVDLPFIVKSTLAMVKDLVTRAHKGKDAEARKILYELANPQASISTIYEFVRFFERYTLRVYEFSFKNVGDRKKTLAHINTGLSDRMSISERFWEHPIDEQVGVIFHEVSHRAGGVDWWRERSDGKIVPVHHEPIVRKEKNGLLLGYRHRSYWKIYEKSGSRFIFNADFWYTLAIYVRRMHDHTGDDRYPLVLRKNHPTMSQHLTVQLQHTIVQDPEPTPDNDGFDGIIEGEQQYPYYDQFHITVDGQGGVKSGASSVKSGASWNSGSSSGSVAWQDPQHPSNPPSPVLAEYDNHNPWTTPDAPPPPVAGSSTDPAGAVGSQPEGQPSGQSKSKGKEKKKESALTNFLLGGSGRKRRK